MSYTLQIYNNTGDNSASASYGANWLSQTFTSVGVFSITRLRLKLYRVGSPGTITVGVRTTSTGKPTTTELTSGTLDGDSLTEDSGGDWYDILLTSYALSATTLYGIVLRATTGDGSNYAVWRNYNAAGGNYAGGQVATSANSGATWTNSSNRDAMFETYSTDPVTIDIAGTVAGTSVIEGVVVVYTAISLEGTIAGVSTLAGVLSFETSVSLSGTIAGTSTISGTITRSQNWQTDNFYATERLTLIGADCFYYEVI